MRPHRSIRIAEYLCLRNAGGWGSVLRGSSRSLAPDLPLFLGGDGGVSAAKYKFFARKIR